MCLKPNHSYQPNSLLASRFFSQISNCRTEGRFNTEDRSTVGCARPGYQALELAGEIIVQHLT